MQKLFFIGNLTRDPEKRITPSGITVCSFTVAVNRRREAEADFFRVTAWRDLAESCAKYLSKGVKVGVVGQVSVSIYKTKDGETHASMDVDAQDVEFCTPKNPEPKQTYVEVTDEKLPWD